MLTSVTTKAIEGARESLKAIKLMHFDPKGLDPDDVLKSMKKLKVGNIPDIYKRFWDLNDKQAETFRKKFSNLTTEPNGGEIKRVLDYISILKDPVGTSTITTKNDKCRLMELRVFPGAILHWNKALGTLDRNELDVQQSVESVEKSNATNAWYNIAQICNDRSKLNPFQPFNRLVKYDENGEKVRGESSNPAIFSIEVSNKLFDIDPNEQTRPLRDAAWVRSNWSDIKRDVSLCWDKFSRSGNHHLLTAGPTSFNVGCLVLQTHPSIAITQC